MRADGGVGRRGSAITQLGVVLPPLARSLPSWRSAFPVAASRPSGLARAFPPCARCRWYAHTGGVPCPWLALILSGRSWLTCDPFLAIVQIRTGIRLGWRFASSLTLPHAWLTAHGTRLTTLDALPTFARRPTHRRSPLSHRVGSGSVTAAAASVLHTHTPHPHQCNLLELASSSLHSTTFLFATYVYV